MKRGRKAEKGCKSRDIGLTAIYTFLPRVGLDTRTHTQVGEGSGAHPKALSPPPGEALFQARSVARNAGPRRQERSLLPRGNAERLLALPSTIRRSPSLMSSSKPRRTQQHQLTAPPPSMPSIPSIVTNERWSRFLSAVDRLGVRFCVCFSVCVCMCVIVCCLWMY